LKSDLPRLNCRLPRLKSGWPRLIRAGSLQPSAFGLAASGTGPPFAPKTRRNTLRASVWRKDHETRDLDPSPSADLRVRISARGPSARYAHLEGDKLGRRDNASNCQRTATQEATLPGYPWRLAGRGWSQKEDQHRKLTVALL